MNDDQSLRSEIEEDLRFVQSGHMTNTRPIFVLFVIALIALIFRS